MTILAIGSSHLTALIRGYGLYCRAHPAPFQLVWLPLQNEIYRPFASRQSGRVVYNERLRQDLATAIGGEDVRQIVCCIGGNVHNVLGLVKHPRPFDFLLPCAVADDTAVGTEVLPYDLLAATIQHRNRPFIDVLGLIKGLAGDLPVCQLCPPPTVARDELILSRPSSFREELERNGLAPARLRWKLWRMYCNVLAESCAELDVTCLDVPEASIDAAGFLREDLWGEDPTHANEAYGLLVVQQITTVSGPKGLAQAHRRPTLTQQIRTKIPDGHLRRKQTDLFKQYYIK